MEKPKRKTIAELEQEIATVRGHLEQSEREFSELAVKHGQLQNEKDKLKAEVAELTKANEAFSEAYNQQLGEIKVLSSRQGNERIFQIILICVALIISFLALFIGRGVSQAQLESAIRESEGKTKTTMDRRFNDKK